jgi:hypothetical protein
MRTRRIAEVVMVLAALALLLANNATVARPTGGEGEASGEIKLTGTVASRISYQGRLADGDGNPLEGTHNLLFQLWDDARAGSQIGMDIVRNNVPVSNGLFTVQLDVPQDAFNGQALWLRVRVNDQWMGRQELLPVPYALSVKPGAVISSPGPDALHVHNTSGGYGVEAWSQGNIGVLGTSGAPGEPPPSGMHGVHGEGEGVGVYGQGGHTGVYGEGSDDGVKGVSTTGIGVEGRSDHANGVAGWTGASGRSGVLGHSPLGTGVTGRSEGSDGLLGVTTSTEAGHAGVRARNEGGGPAVVSEGDLVLRGAFRGDLGPNGGAPFPRPAYDSDWREIHGAILLRHDLGGETDNYVVDLQFAELPDLRPHQFAYGGDHHLDRYDGGYWCCLDEQAITVCAAEQSAVDYVRVRIWVYE